MVREIKRAWVGMVLALVAAIAGCSAGEQELTQEETVARDSVSLDVQSAANDCGYGGGTCCPTEPQCQSGLSCIGNICKVACGNPGQVCCAPSRPGGQPMCYGGFCNPQTWMCQ